MPSPVLGIDLGTTNSVVAYADAQHVRVLRDEEGRFLTPSTVSFLDPKTTLVGHPARDRRLVDVENTVFSVKRLIGRPFRSAEVRRAAERLPFKLEEGQTGGVVVRVRDETFSLPEISSFILRRLRALAEQTLGQACQNAVITVPANFNELQRMATRDAGRIAGLNVLRILNEPTAAALAYGYRAQQQQRIAVYDFGGGTFDISILELSGDVIEVVATAGDTHLGGDDLDRALADHMVADFAAKHGIDLQQHPQQYQRITLAAEWLKCQLSDQEAAEVTVRQVAIAKGTPLDLKFKLLRNELYELCSPLIGRTFTICEDALRLAGVRPAQLDAVILVGGQTRTPRVREMVEEYFGIQPKYSVDPDLAVAQGAALQGYALSGVPAANQDKRSPVRTLAGPGAKLAAGSSARPIDGGFDDEPTRVEEPKKLVPPPPPPPPPAAGRRSETPFDDLPTTISRRDPDFEPTKVGEVRVPVGSVRPYGAVGTHPATLSGVGGASKAPAGGHDADHFTADDVLELLVTDASARETLAEMPNAKAGVRTPRRSSAPPHSAAVTPLVPGPFEEEVDLPVVLQHDEPETYEEFEINPSTTLMERPSAKAKTRPPSAAAPPPAASAAAPATADTEGEPIRTHSMARLLASQGHLARALSIYDELLLRNPGDATLALVKEARALRAQLRPTASDSEQAAIDLPRLSTPLVGGAAANALLSAPHAPTPIPAPAAQSLQSTFPAPPSIAPLLLDVTPHTLCVETVGGFCEQIIERNAPIPTEQTRVFSTSRDNQATVSVRVCQGESRRTDENQVLGQIDLLGLRPARRGEVSIAVTFVIDADGTLNVRAVDEGTGRGQEIEVNLVGAIGGPEIERMRARQRGLAS